MHNLKVVIIFEFLKTIKKKTFWLSVLAVPVLITVVFSLSYFSNKSASETKNLSRNQKVELAIYDESGLIKQSELDSRKAERLDNKEAGVRRVVDGELEAFVFIPSDPKIAPLEVFAQDAGITKNSKYSNLARNLLRSSIIVSLESPEQATLLNRQPETILKTYKNGELAAGIEQVVLPAIYLVLFYLLIILLGNQMLTSTTEEKENRVIEIILTSVKAGNLIVGKIIAMILLAMLQFGIILMPIFIGLTFFRDRLNIPFIDMENLLVAPERILIGGIMFVFSFLLFTGILVTIGAIVPTAKEAGGFFGMAIFFMFIPLYAVTPIITDPGQIIVRIFSFFPMTAPITLMLRNAIGNLSSVEAFFGILILAVSSILTLMIAIRAFRVGTLEYEHKLNLLHLFKK